MEIFCLAPWIIGHPYTGTLQAWRTLIAPSFWMQPSINSVPFEYETLQEHLLQACFAWYPFSMFRKLACFSSFVQAILSEVIRRLVLRLVTPGSPALVMVTIA